MNLVNISFFVVCLEAFSVSKNTKAWLQIVGLEHNDLDRTRR